MSGTIQLKTDDDFSPALANRGVCYYAIQTLTGQRLGYCYLVTDAALSKQTGNIGYYIEPEHRNHGYAVQALLLLVKAARRQRLEEIAVYMDKGNGTSRAVLWRALAKLGSPPFVETILADERVCVRVQIRNP